MYIPQTEFYSFFMKFIPAAFRYDLAYIIRKKVGNAMGEIFRDRFSD